MTFVAPRRKHQALPLREQLEIVRGEPAPPRDEIIETRQLTEADARGDIGEIRFTRDPHDIHFAFGCAFDAMKAQLFECADDAPISGCNRSALDRRQVLVGMETEADNIAL